MVWTHCTGHDERSEDGNKQVIFFKQNMMWLRSLKNGTGHTMKCSSKTVLCVVESWMRFRRGCAQWITFLIAVVLVAMPWNTRTSLLWPLSVRSFWTSVIPKPGVAPKKLELVFSPVHFLIECPLRGVVFSTCFFSLIYLRVHVGPFPCVILNTRCAVRVDISRVSIIASLWIEGPDVNGLRPRTRCALTWQRLGNICVLLHVPANGDNPASVVMTHMLWLHGQSWVRARTTHWCGSLYR